MALYTESTFSVFSSPIELPFDVQLRILACLQIEDLFASCLLVCKQWKDAILSSDFFARLQYRHSWSDFFAKLQYRHSWWGYVISKSVFDFKALCFPNKKKLVFQNGPYKVLNLTMKLLCDEMITCSDHGIVCIIRCTMHGGIEQMKIGNPIKDDWKVVPIPFEDFFPRGMSVDTSTSPASFKVVFYRRKSSSMHASIFDSKTNSWSERNTISLDGPFEDKLGQTLVLTNIDATKKIVTYNFEQDIWSVKSYLLPEEKTDRKQIILCKEEPILVSYLWPFVMLWKEKSCCKGIINWGLMSKLNTKAFLAQHKLKPLYEGRAVSWCTHYMGDVIMVMVALSPKKAALLNYDIRKGCWNLGGLMEGALGAIDMEFAPSLITV